MDDRTKTLFSFFALATVLTTAGCGLNQQARFQMSFLPRAPHAGVTEPETTPAPPVAGNPYLQHKLPSVIPSEPLSPRARSRGDNLMQAADQAFQRGRRAYVQGDILNARKEFDSAVDMMLEASEENPANRAEYDNRMEDLVEAVHKLDLAGMGVSAAVEQGKFEKAPLEDILQMTFPVDPKLKNKVRDQVSATTSSLPLSVNDTVLGYINYFSNRGHRTLVAATQRSGKYRPMIYRILDEEGVPRELLHLAQAESGFIPRAISRAAAGGMWQFLKWRGNQYGLMQTRYTDDRMDPEKATRAAARHLRDLYSEFGDWYLAIAAYNCGPGAVERAVERTGYADFWELRSRGVLPAETTNYVPIILAMTIMEKNAAAYGLEGIQLDAPLEYDSVDTTAPTSLQLVADIAETSLSQVAEMNPAALRGMVPEKYTIRVPKGAGKRILATLEMVPAEHRDSWRMHLVGPGENLSAIAKRYGASPAGIASVNKLASADTMEGDRLLIPAAMRAEVPVRVRPTAGRSTSRSTAGRTATAVRSSRPSQNTGRTRKSPVIVARNSGR